PESPTLRKGLLVVWHFCDDLQILDEELHFPVTGVIVVLLPQNDVGRCSFTSPGPRRGPSGKHLRSSCPPATHRYPQRREPARTNPRSSPSSDQSGSGECRPGTSTRRTPWC